MIKDVMIIECDECNDAGFIFFGNDNDFDVETCDCVTNANDGLTLDWVNN
jgi:hypothetical protein